jgi:multidrug efflux pump subunit AcrA (membrane-fusion protein)
MCRSNKKHHVTGWTVSVRRTLSIISILLVVIFGCKGDAPSYRTEPVTLGDIQQTVTATGTVSRDNGPGRHSGVGDH